jgi:hypothetical protein
MPRDFFDPPLDENRVLISRDVLNQAALLICCEACNPDAEIPFNWVYWITSRAVPAQQLITFWNVRQDVRTVGATSSKRLSLNRSKQAVELSDLGESPRWFSTSCGLFT